MAESRTPKYKRILLKISGEALMGQQGYGINPEVLLHVASEIAETARLGVEVAVVVGGGNIFRGVSESARGMDRASADYVGMLATVMNAVSLQEAIEKQGVVTRVQSAIPMSQLAEPYIRRRRSRPGPSPGGGSRGAGCTARRAATSGSPIARGSPRPASRSPPAATPRSSRSPACRRSRRSRDPCRAPIRTPRGRYCRRRPRPRPRRRAWRYRRSRPPRASGPRG